MPILPLPQRVKTELDTVQALMAQVQDATPPEGYRGVDPLAAQAARNRVHDYLERQKLRRYAYAKLIRYADVETGEEREVRVTSADLAATDLAVVKRNAPILAALLPAREGDIVQVRLPRGERDIEVIEVRYLDRHDPIFGHYDDFLALRDGDKALVRELRRWLEERQSRPDDGVDEPVVGEELAAEDATPTEDARPTRQSERESRLRDEFYWSPTREQEDAMRGHPRGLVVVLGVAGSGKTSAALGRMAMLHLRPEGAESPEFFPENGIGVVLNQSLVGYLRRAMGGQLGLEGMPVRAYTSIRQSLIERRDLLLQRGAGEADGVSRRRRVRRGGATSDVEALVSSLTWHEAVSRALVPRILRSLKDQLGDLPTGWSAAAAGPPVAPPEYTEVGFAQRRAVPPIWAELRGQVLALELAAVARPDARGLVQRVDALRGALADALENHESWAGSKLKRVRRAIRNSVKTRFEGAFTFVERYLEVVNDAEGRAALFTAVGVDPLSRLAQGMCRRWEERRLADGEIDGLLLFAETASSGYTGREGAEAVAELEEGPRYTHMFIDEFQDFTEVQFALLNRLVSAATDAVFAVGDFQQRLNPAGLTETKSRTTIFLSENKRQTAPLHALSADFRVSLQGERRPLLGAPSQMADERPWVLATDAGDLEPALTEAIVQARRAGLSVAVICPHANRALELHTRLRDELEAENALPKLSADNDASNLCDTTFVHFTTPPPVKGLEFDAVFVVDVEAYDMGDAVARDQLYVALTRGRRRLGLGWRAALAPDLQAVMARNT